MKHFLLEYSGPAFDRFTNLGDYIQTIAASRLIPEFDGHLNRESLSSATETGVVVLNGFFMHTANWPPASGLTPVFYSFHVRPRSEATICSPSGLEYLARNGPIGCRDPGTLELLRKHGVDAYYSKCLTLTLPRREKTPRNGMTFLVGVSKAGMSVIPRALRKRSVEVNQHSVRVPGLSEATKMAMANEVLEAYRKTASLVITSKIHCAMPCIAMGIPVVFLYDNRKLHDYRVRIINDLIGINYVPGSWINREVINKIRPSGIDWSPQPVDIESIKSEITSGFYAALEAARNRHAERHPEA